MSTTHITSKQIDGEKNGNCEKFIVLAPKSLRMVTAAMRLKDAWPLDKEL